MPRSLSRLGILLIVSTFALPALGFAEHSHERFQMNRDVRLDDGAKIAGDVAAIGGTVRRSPQATIAGDVSSMGGAGWVILAFAVPLLLVAGLIALVVWLLRRARSPQPFPASPVQRV